MSLGTLGTMPSELENLGLFYRELYRSRFRADVAAGTARPLVLPFDLLGSFVVPIVYLCIPHTRRPWLYAMRFAVMALVVHLNLAMMRSASSANMAAAYAVGLMGAWGIIWGMKLLIWTRPQFEAARVETRLRRRPPPGTVSNGNGALPARGVKAGVHQDKSTAPDESVSEVLDEYEYYWQAYPADSPFLTRLSWVVDLVTAFRGSGWNWAISSIPHFQRPDNPLSGELVKLSTIPLATRSGYTRFPTYLSFFRDRLRRMTWAYFALDFCSVFMMKDPYFVLGPGTPHPLPPFLASLPTPLLEAWRSAVSLLGIISALTLIFYADQLLRCCVTFLLRRLRPHHHHHPIGPRNDLWQHASIFGSFSNVLDRGLAGFWGAWWHQTFRGAFTAPAAWLSRRRGVVGHPPRPSSPGAVATTALGALVAFVQSGALHAAGGATTVPRETVWWGPPVFFLLSWVGVVVQAAVAAAGDGRAQGLPRWLRRAGNLAFVVVWLHLTRWAFIDDLCRAAIWLFEPVPASPLRALGLGKPGDTWWRWDRDLFPRWHVGRHWWEMGVAL